MTDHSAMSEDVSRRARTLDDGSDAGGYIVPPAVLAQADTLGMTCTDKAAATSPAPRIIGLDLSLTSTGVAGIHHGQWWTDRIRTKELRGHPRIAYLLDAVGGFTRRADLVVIEGLAYDAHDTNRGNAGLSWLVRHGLWRRGIAYVLVPPANRCQYATGKGRADKRHVVAAVQATYGAAVVTNDDEADALVLAAMGARHVGRPIDGQLPVTHLAAMAGVPWPELVST